MEAAQPTLSRIATSRRGHKRRKPVAGPAGFPLTFLFIVLLGVGIGATGIGGVGLVPVLTGLAGMPLELAVPTGLAAFVVTGIVGMVLHRQSLRKIEIVALISLLATAFGSVVGALIFPYIVGSWLVLVIGLLMLLAGGLELARQRKILPPATRGMEKSLPIMAVLGIAVGCGSAITGTGGPVLFVPIMLLLGGEIRATIAIAQILQIPVAGAATAVHLGQSGLDYRHVALIGLLLGLGAIFGALLARLMDTTRLRVIVAWTMLLGGTFYLLSRL